jgi:hypothetical protein
LAVAGDDRRPAAVAFQVSPDVQAFGNAQFLHSDGAVASRSRIAVGEVLGMVGGISGRAVAHLVKVAEREAGRKLPFAGSIV